MNPLSRNRSLDFISHLDGFDRLPMGRKRKLFEEGPTFRDLQDARGVEVDCLPMEKKRRLEENSTFENLQDARGVGSRGRGEQEIVKELTELLSEARKVEAFLIRTRQNPSLKEEVSRWNAEVNLEFREHRLQSIRTVAPFFEKQLDEQELQTKSLQDLSAFYRGILSSSNGTAMLKEELKRQDKAMYLKCQKRISEVRCILCSPNGQAVAESIMLEPSSTMPSEFFYKNSN